MEGPPLKFGPLDLPSLPALTLPLWLIPGLGVVLPLLLSAYLDGAPAETGQARVAPSLAADSEPREAPDARRDMVPALAPPHQRRPTRPRPPTRAPTRSRGRPDVM